MRQYHSNNKNYNAILESMVQIRQNQLNEQYGYYSEGDDDSYDGAAGGMRAAYGGRIPEDDPEMLMMGMHDDEEEMEEGMRRRLMAAHGGMHGDEDEMEEGMHDDDEDAQMEALAEMMDEALMELDDEDDGDNQMLDEDEDDERRARRRARLRNALLIGAGLVATGGVAGAAAANPAFRQGLGNAAMGAKDFVGNMIQAPGKTSEDALAAAQRAYSSIKGVPSAQGAAAAGLDALDATQAAMGADVGAKGYNRMALPANAKFDSDAFGRGITGARARRGSSQQMAIDPKAQRQAAQMYRSRKGNMIPGGM